MNETQSVECTNRKISSICKRCTIRKSHMVARSKCNYLQTFQKIWLKQFKKICKCWQEWIRARAPWSGILSVSSLRKHKRGGRERAPRSRCGGCCTRARPGQASPVKIFFEIYNIWTLFAPLLWTFLARIRTTLAWISGSPVRVIPGIAILQNFSRVSNIGWNHGAGF